MAADRAAHDHAEPRPRRRSLERREPAPPAFPYVRTGAYTLLDLAAQYTFARNFDVVFGFKNLTDDNYELAWGFPQPGRTFYIKTRLGL